MKVSQYGHIASKSLFLLAIMTLDV